VFTTCPGLATAFGFVSHQSSVGAAFDETVIASGAASIAVTVDAQCANAAVQMPVPHAISQTSPVGCSCVANRLMRTRAAVTSPSAVTSYSAGRSKRRSG
jgi:hypothetical protein